MLKNQSLSVKEAVHTLQLHLLDGITSDNNLLAAGSLFSRDDYRDVVIERTIDNNCGYPLCRNVLPRSRNRKGRFRISLKEHKVYDLKETYLYCSSGCLVNSRAFEAVLKNERCSFASESKLNEILSLFLDSNPNTDKTVVRNGDLKLSELRIHENVDVNHGRVSLQNWMGPSNAVEGYVPVRDNSVKSSCLNSRNNDVEARVDILAQNHIHHSSDDFEENPIRIKSAKKVGVLTDNLLNYEDSWLDEPPDGFSLSLSTFSMMWNALYEWVTLSSLAYIYGRNESQIEEFLQINGHEYTRKVILSDGRSAEIKQTLSGCLSRALPELVTNLKLPIPISSLEHSLSDVLDTMSFMWSIPALRVKQWQIMNLLLIESLSAYQIPSLSSHMISAQFHKVLEGADVSLEEYEAMRDVVLPLGRRI